jgi:hypothetical protein
MNRVSLNVERNWKDYAEASASGNHGYGEWREWRAQLEYKSLCDLRAKWRDLFMRLFRKSHRI